MILGHLPVIYLCEENKTKGLRKLHKILWPVEKANRHIGLSNLLTLYSLANIK